MPAQGMHDLQRLPTRTPAHLRRDHADVGGDTGAIRRVEVKDNSVKTSADYLSGYQLVEYDAANQELLRWGISPLLAEIPNNHEHPHQRPQHEADERRRLLLGESAQSHRRGADRSDHRHADASDSFSAGRNAPIVSISSPAGGENFTSGTRADRVDGDRCG